MKLELPNGVVVTVERAALHFPPVAYPSLQADVSVEIVRDEERAEVLLSALQAMGLATALLTTALEIQALAELS